MFKNKTILFRCMFICVFILGCENQENFQLNYIEPSCLAEQSRCEIKTNHESFWVLFNIDAVKTETEFEVSLKSDTKDRIVKVISYMEGKEMFMGKVPLFFDTSKSASLYTATSMLGSCSEERMIWIMWFEVTIERAHNNISHEKFSIEFTSQRH